MRRGIRLKGIKRITKPNGRTYTYRRVGAALVPLPDLPENHPDFLRAYLAAADAAPVRAHSHAPGSIGAACVAYLGSPAYRTLADSTARVFRRVIDKIAQERGKGLLRDLRPEHLRRDLSRLTPGAASNRLKAWRQVLRHAVERGDLAADPSTGIRPPRARTTPHRQWTLAEIATFRAKWQQGTPERTAFEVLFWTAARCSDAVTLGWQMVDRDVLSYVQQKTGGRAACPVGALPAWAQGMAEDYGHFIAALPDRRDRLQWIVTRTGKPRSVKGVSQWISAAATAAGLPDDCTAHGLRKARAAAIAATGAGARRIGAWTGHASLSEIAHYTREADQRDILGMGEVETRVTQFPKAPKS